MQAKRFAQSGHLSRDGQGFVLIARSGIEHWLTAWPAADRYLNRRVHVVGLLAPDKRLAAESIAPLD